MFLHLAENVLTVSGAETFLSSVLVCSYSADADSPIATAVKQSQIFLAVPLSIIINFGEDGLLGPIVDSAICPLFACYGILLPLKALFGI